MRTSLAVTVVGVVMVVVVVVVAGMRYKFAVGVALEASEAEPAGTVTGNAVDPVHEPARQRMPVTAAMTMVVVAVMMRAAPVAMLSAVVVTDESAATLFRPGVEQVVMVRIGVGSEGLLPLRLDQEGNIAVLRRSGDVGPRGEAVRGLGRSQPQE